ncbi:type I DNA topoisomerase [Patescibacteria group bacterium]|nr:type I DNA topoisomerase [Patescibacteria group bacterium]MCL5010422.1 type I DNA topoisomerase [Patescibacteria group bacterium]
MQTLVIVESPTKARTIGRFLGNGYIIKASMGHVMDLPKSRLGVDEEHNFAPQYEIVEDKKKIIRELKEFAKGADSVILATDPDREGEAIAHHVREILPISNTANKQIKRIVFHEITKEAIEEAFKNPRDIDLHLVHAQTARRVLDRLVGYKLSPLLWQKVRRGLSAGRVQSVALRLIVEREKEIEKFVKNDYFTIHVFLSQNTQKTQGDSGNQKVTEFELTEINGKKIELQESFRLYDGGYTVTKTSIKNQESAQKIIDDLKTKGFVVADVSQKEIRRTPPPPYTTSTLQQDASRRLGFSARKTMLIAQKLYEEGHITYHRTDSVAMAQSATMVIRSYIKKTFGEKYIPDKPRFFKTKQKLAQEAHEAIRPTAAGQIPNLKSQILNLGRDCERLYDLIWKRALASQASTAVLESTTVYADAVSENSDVSGTVKYRLKAGGSVLVFDGFLKINPQALNDNVLPKFKASERLKARDISFLLHQTPPPPRYSDASLIKTLEQNGIGRPSTYAAIISTIESRNYTEKKEGRFLPTVLGVSVSDFLAANFSAIDDIPFTAGMEDELDDIAKGEKKWAVVIKDFYFPFSEIIEKVKKAERVKIPVVEVDEKCPKCDSALVVRVGRFGKFLACSKFPQCKFTKQFLEETNFTCPKDKGKIIVKKTKKGRRFYGCSNYPACDFAAWRLADIGKTNSKST